MTKKRPAQQKDPIAVVGMGCRFPGAEGLHAFWEMLIEGRDGIGPVPSDRFPIEMFHDPKPGQTRKIAAREGGFLRNIRAFDASLFGLSHRDAMHMDPQHRLLLEVAWEAFEDAGLSDKQIQGARAGVYIGCLYSDYRELLFQHNNIDLDVYAEIGTTRSSAAGRISYAFNLVGPSVVLDAACTSSLLAVHLAAQSIWSGESDFALAGGSNIILNPEASICFSRSSMLSPDSRCQFGDVNANGFVRSDGIGIAILKPLAQAQADGDRIYSVLRASASNNDARQGQGLYMTPSRAGQTALLQQVYEEHDLPLERLHFVEAHGTGTRAGDPVETGALAAVLGHTRDRENPLYVGSVKSNIGHTEGAAGIAGFMKTALSLYHQQLPPSLHCQQQNPDIPWYEGHLAVPTTVSALPQKYPTVLAGISSFGLSGTNAHVVLESIPRSSVPTVEAPPNAPTWVLGISAHTAKALVQRAQSWHQALRTLSEEDNSRALHDFCYTATVRRTHLSHRLSVVGPSRDMLCEQLQHKISALSLEEEYEPARTPRLVMVFPGQGGQWAGMGQALYRTEPMFRRVLEEIDRSFQRHVSWSLCEILQDDEAAWQNDIAQIQPMLFAIQVGLARLWASRGLRPDAVIGHSLGEVAAAHIAGALSLDDAVTVLQSRSHHLKRTSGSGAMALVQLGPEETQAAIQDFKETLTVAVSNSFRSTVIAGVPEDVATMLDRFQKKGLFCRSINVDVASHTPLMDPLLPDFRNDIQDIQPTQSTIPLYSSVQAKYNPEMRFDIEYWLSNLRQSVRFAETSKQMMEDGYNTFLEIGPHPVLLRALQQTAQDHKHKIHTLSCMQRQQPGDLSMWECWGALYEAGIDVDWSEPYPTGRLVPLPTYPFQHENFWLFPEQAETTRIKTLSQTWLPQIERQTEIGTDAHPLLPRHFRLASDADTRVWEVPLSTRLFPYLADHCVRGSAILPGAAYIEIALAAAQEAFATRRYALTQVEFRDYLVVPTQKERSLQIVMKQSSDDGAEFRFYSFDPRSKSSRLHALLHLNFLQEEQHTLSGEEFLAVTSATTPDPTQSPRLLLEQLHLELERKRLNDNYNFAVLGITLSEQKLQSSSAHAKLHRLLQEIVRGEDLVYKLSDQRSILVLRSVKELAHVDLAVKRIRERLLESLREHQDKRQPSMFVRVIDSVYTEPAQIFEDLENIQQNQSALNENWITIERESKSRLPQIRALQTHEFYESMEQRGVHYGSTFQGLQRVEYSPQFAKGSLQLPATVQAESQQYLLHPAILDVCFQVASSAFIQTHPNAARTDTYLPVGIRKLQYHSSPTGKLQCRSWLRGWAGENQEEIELDFLITNDQGQKVVEVDGFRIQRFARRGEILIDDQQEGWFYTWDWQLAAPEQASSQTRTWLLFDSPQESGRALQERLEGQGHHCLRIIPLASEQGDKKRASYQLVGWSEEIAAKEKSLHFASVAQVFAALHRQMQALSGVITLWDTHQAQSSDPHELPIPSLAEACMKAVEVAREVASYKHHTDGAQYWTVTCGARHIPHIAEPPDYRQAPLWGLGRVIANELLELRVRHVDLSGSPQDQEWTQFTLWLQHPTEEDEIAIRDGQSFVHRLQHTDFQPDSKRILHRIYTPSHSYRLEWHAQQEEESLQLLPSHRRTYIAPQEVELHVTQAAFIKSPALDGQAQPPLVVCVGEIAQLGEEVQRLDVKQKVLALLPKASEGVLVQRFHTLASTLVVPLPKDLRSTDALQIAVYGLPAHLGLQTFGHMQGGDRVLIHHAHEGVGAAAVTLAKSCGAKIYATAKNIESREALRQEGIPFVFDPKTPEFSAQLLDLTAHEGIDICLQANHRTPLPLDLSLLAPGGRWLDIYRRLQTRTEGDQWPTNVSYSTIDIVALNQQRPRFLQHALQTLLAQWHDQQLLRPKALRHRDQEWSQFTKRFAHSQAGDVLWWHFDTPTFELTQEIEAAHLFDPNGSYILTGGTGGLGTQLTRWMAERGAKHITLLSRSGEKAPVFRGLQQELYQQDVHVSAYACDVSSYQEMKAVFAQVSKKSPPLAGVFHLAMLLDDTTLQGLSQERFEGVMRPKIQGAWNLHLLTQELPLEYFVLFSSVAPLIGSPGQANYAAANTFLDMLSDYRRAHGLAGQSINWGAWADIGRAAIGDKRGARLELRGLSSMSPKEAFEALEWLLLHNTNAQVGIFSMDWRRWSETFPRYARTPVVSHLLSEIDHAHEALEDMPLNWLERFQKQQDVEAQLSMLQQELKEQLADVLGMPPAKIHTKQPLSRLGLDSLMAVELRSRIYKQFELEVSATDLLAFSHLEAMADQLLLALQSLAQTEPSAELAAETGHQAYSEMYADVHHLRLDKAPQSSTDIVLDPSIQNTQRYPAQSEPSTDVLLTGATGFLGAHLLRSLLDQSSAKIHCLVRADHTEHARERLRQNLTLYGLWKDGDEARISPFAGDLSQPLLGLSESLFESLAATVQEIYHSGAFVNHIYPYVRLAEANVAGTQEIIRLAAQHHPKVIHHISTLVVFPFLHNSETTEIDEHTAPNALPEAFFFGYAQTKWAAEHLILQARQRGLRAHIYRPAGITGSHHTHLNPNTDLIWRVVQAVVQTKGAPPLQRGILLTPVDAVADAIFALAQQKESYNQNYHLFGEQSFSFDTLIQCLQEQGYEVTSLTHEAWGDRLAELPPDSAAAPLIPLLQDFDPTALNEMRAIATSTHTRQALPPKVLEALSVTPALMHKYIEKLRETEFLPKP